MVGLSYSVSATTFMCLLYIILGLLSILCNILNISTWMSSQKLRKKFIYLIALDVFELVNAVSYVLVGTGRGWALLGNYLSTPITIRECFFKKYWPHLLILGTQLPSFGIILISCERLCAVLRPVAYKRFFTGHSKLFLLLMIPVAGMISLVSGGLSTIGEAGDEVVPSQHCAIIASTATWYSTFHFVFIVFAYVICFISIFVVWKISKRFSGVKVGGDNHFGVMLIITGSSIILISSESIVMLLIRWNISTFSDMVVAITYAMPGFLSIFNTLINAFFRAEFRKQLLVLIRVRESKPQIADVRPVVVHIRSQHSATKA